MVKHVPHDSNYGFCGNYYQEKVPKMAAERKVLVRKGLKSWQVAVFIVAAAVVGFGIGAYWKQQQTAAEIEELRGTMAVFQDQAETLMDRSYWGGVYDAAYCLAFLSKAGQSIEMYYNDSSRAVEARLQKDRELSTRSTE
jgi:hypothetical protein